ncbi:hypothetical protein [Algoriphagus resistens]|uniref:hypothetical protein n=1 Tax=Algoriphagus resistens TaxID=1750590 RepID=UPI00071684FF|nr:hypothetical protein [Algoriphagus resistens]
MSFHFSHCRFSLFIREDSGRIFYSLDSFDSPDSDYLIRSRQPKIYVIKSEEDFLYVGYASQSLITRLNQGFRANGKNGYHGYKWKKLEKVEVHVFVFPILADTPAKESRLFFEAIEAELVFQIRTQTGKWPLSQNEIHFNNYFLEEAERIAGELIEEL